MFNNSGMAQFKEYFLGNATPKVIEFTHSKCLRVSGKHNDLEDVGLIPIIIPCSEMLGNHFGDILRKALPWAWEFLTEVLKLEKDLYVSVLKETNQRMCL
jgi:alanyl-tRNA synthetase